MCLGSFAFAWLYMLLMNCAFVLALGYHGKSRRIVTHSLCRLFMLTILQGYEFASFPRLYCFKYLTEPGHVNNVTYVRYAETARVNFMRNFATHLDPANRKAWINLLSSTSIGLILRSIKIDYKFVRVLLFG